MAGTYTDNYTLYRPEVDETGWGALVAGNFTTIDTQLELVESRVNTMIQDGTGITWSYDSTTKQLTPTVSILGLDTGDLPEGSNLYYTDERVDDRVNALIVDGTGLTATYDDGAGTYTLDLGALTTNWDAGAYEIRALTFESDQTTGTAPLTIASTTVVSNLNADQVDGKDSTDLVLVDGTQALTANWDVGAYTITGTRFISDIAGGTAPFGVTSTTVVPNLNVDQVDGKDSTDLVLVDGTQALTANWDVGAYTITALTFVSDQTTGTAPLTVASTTVVTNLNADTVDGIEGSNLAIAVISFIFDAGASAISAGAQLWLRIPFACTINRVTTMADQSGSIKIDIWKDTYANYPPTNADTITGANEPEISGATKDEDATLTSWTTSISADDILLANVDSCATIQKCAMTLKVTKT